ncbi:hypothetical protein BJX63DRAFT_282690 [Aspergillus granulosus]|uniref:Secreted protein n=1 Tax=Aspergillus granulosus TaxID=176169 RepID=A0ABR4HZ05_9EURO
MAYSLKLELAAAAAAAAAAAVETKVKNQCKQERCVRGSLVLKPTRQSIHPSPGAATQLQSCSRSPFSPPLPPPSSPPPFLSSLPLRFFLLFPFLVLPWIDYSHLLWGSGCRALSSPLAPAR